MEDGAGEETNIRVVVRCRPLNSKEKNNSENSIVRMGEGVITLMNPAGNNDDHSFSFDSIFGPDCLQSEVWETVGLPILDKAIAGYNGTIFAYGQTGSGKTWSMQGGDEDLKGIIPRMSISLFEKVALETQSRSTTKFLITASYFEIYNEVIFDLLDTSDRKKRLANNKGGLEIKEHPALGVYVKGLQEIVVEDGSKLQGIIDQGMRNRTVASTQMNADSSRSHSVFMITVHQKDTEDESKNIFAKINLVDLAGSERVKSTGATGATLKEGANINKSLSALGNVINALVEAGKGKNTFIPYRNSKLTRVLQESLGGNSITTMLAALSPAACNFEETLSTLKYANRAKAIKVKAVKNEEASQVSRLNDEIRLLREKLAQQGERGDFGGAGGLGSEKNQQQLAELEMALKNTWESKALISKEYEQERNRLLQEQQAAAQQLRAAKERNWNLLEEKGEAELSISHVKEICKAAPVSFSTTNLEEQVDTLLRQLLAFESQEKKAQDQQSICDVFRNALEKDVNGLLQLKCLSAEHHNSILISLRQVCSKAQALQEEIQRWLPVIRHAVKSLHDVRRFAESLFQRVYGAFGKCGEELREEVLRGLWLIVKQLRDREVAISSRFISAGKAVEDAGNVREGLKTFGAQYELAVKRDIVSWSNAEEVLKVLSEAVRSMKYLQQSSESKSADHKDSVHEESVPYIMKDNESFFIQTVGNSDADHSDSTTIVSTQAFSGVENGSSYDSSKTVILDLQESISVHSVQFIPAMIAQDPSRRNNGLMIEDGDDEIVDGGDNEGDNGNEAKYFQRNGSAPIFTNVASATSLASVGSMPFTALQMPSGLSSMALIDFYQQHLDSPESALDDGAMEVIAKDTAQGLADLLDWTVLLKQHDPVKFLRRPPVRFLFDLFQYLANQYKCCIHTLLQPADWIEVSATRESKTAYMSTVLESLVSEIREVCDPIVRDLLVKAVQAHSGNSIVAGLDTDKTNRILQLLTVLVHRRHSMHSVLHSSGSAVMSSGSLVEGNGAPSEVSRTKKSGVANRVTNARSLICIQSARIRVSEDGVTWTEVMATSSSQDKDVLVLTCSTSDSGCRGRYVALTVDAFSSQKLDANTDSASDLQNLAIRARVLGQSVFRQQTKPRLLSSAQTVWQRLSESWHLWTNVAATTVSCEQHERSKRLDEARKRIEKEAAEQAQRAQSLANEKVALQSSNADLAAQLQKMMEQLIAAQQTIGDLQQTVQRLEEESSGLREQVSQREQQNAALDTQRMMLETALEKEKNAVGQLESDMYDKEQTLAEALGDLKAVHKKYEELEAEKEDLQQAMQVMQEERDTARQHEEELFERLGDVTADLERLQESYVDVCDRCNDAQDEASELRDQIQSLQEALQTLRQQNLNKPVNNSTTHHSAPSQSVVVSARNDDYEDDYENPKSPEPVKVDLRAQEKVVTVKGDSTPQQKKSANSGASKKGQPSSAGATAMSNGMGISGGRLRSSDDSVMPVTAAKTASNVGSPVLNLKGYNSGTSSNNNGLLSARSGGAGEEDDYQEDFDDT